MFETLYLVITYGHETAELAAKIDPPDDYYRIRWEGGGEDERKGRDRGHVGHYPHTTEPSQPALKPSLSLRMA